ncbi:MAG: Gfo/Idh/MocA family oxidoreductase [Gammaproteobacteria bacterium]|nr:Gfo/Idh/MocA family oxidoreductase [Gammaproteobacteria bacterium]MDH5261585.1 Gfo/Idh/MocA family oxidoreductase [Gammaproteobacteria bacterium]
MSAIEVAVVGVGGWGKNLARNYYQLPEANLKYICDLDEAKLKAMARQYPGVRTSRSFDEILADDALQAVVIATTGPSHYKLVKQALLAGKDVYVEKPFVLNVPDAVELTELAAKSDRILMVGHLLEYHPVIIRLREMIEAGALGNIYYIYSQRLNLGTVRGDENAMWNFAPHDISSILYLLGKEPVDVSARGQHYLQKNIHDVVFLTLSFADSTMAHIHVSWLDPHKVRKLTIVGSQKMAVFDDLEATEKLKIYDKGARVSQDYNTFAEYIGLRFGDITIPYVKTGEPLQTECMHFLDCVRNRVPARSDGRDGLRVVRVLESAQRSLEMNGAPVSLL